MLPRKWTIKSVFYFSTSPTWGNMKPEFGIFSFKCWMFFNQKHTKHIKISPICWTTIHCQNDWLGASDRTWEGSILLFVTHMLYVNQVCHGVGRCVKIGVFFVKPGVKVNGQYELDILPSQQNVWRYQTHHRLQFSHCACSTVQLLQRSRLIRHLSEKMWFFVFPVLPDNAEAQVIWGGIVKRILTAYIENISAQKYQNPFMYVKVIANQRWVVFWDTV